MTFSCSWEKMPEDFVSAVFNIMGHPQRTVAVPTSFPSGEVLLEHSLALALAMEAHSGWIMEFGVFSGSTIRQLASITDREVHGFDSFRGLPEDWRVNSEESFQQGAFDLLGQPPKDLPDNVQLHVGWINETLPKFLVDQPKTATVSFLHVDVDLQQHQANSGFACVPPCVWHHHII